MREKEVRPRIVWLGKLGRPRGRRRPSSVDSPVGDLMDTEDLLSLHIPPRVYMLIPLVSLLSAVD
jgi:hypothetical protein